MTTSSCKVQGSPILSAYFSNGSPIIESFVEVQLTFSSAVFTDCQVTSSSAVVGSLATWNVTVKPTVAVETNQSLVMTLPLWSPMNLSNFQNVSCSTPCTSSTDTVETITINNVFSSGSTFSVLLFTIRNPTSTIPIGISFSIVSSLGTVQTCSTTFSSSQPNSLINTTFTNSNRTISASNAIILNTVTQTPLPAGCYLRLSTSLSVSYTYVPLNPNKPQRITTTDGSLLLGNLTSTNRNSLFPLTIGNFTVQNPRYSGKPVAISIST